jgi:uncharacterized protein YndB with AHSA1/START domain
MSARINQGRDEIIVEAPASRVWPLVTDSRHLPEWGPPVESVEVVSGSDAPEGLGSRRRIQARFGGKRGYIVEERIEHDEGRKIAYLIQEESFGMSRVMRDAGFSMEVVPVGHEQTRIVFSVFWTPNGLVGALMNRLVLRRAQRKNRLAALAALKALAEGGKAA